MRMYAVAVAVVKIKGFRKFPFHIFPGFAYFLGDAGSVANLL